MTSRTPRSCLVPVLLLGPLAALSPAGGAASDAAPTAARPPGEITLPREKMPFRKTLKGERSKPGAGRDVIGARDAQKGQGDGQRAGAAKASGGKASGGEVSRPLRPGPAVPARPRYKQEAPPVRRLLRKDAVGKRLPTDRLPPSPRAGGLKDSVRRAGTPGGVSSKEEPGGKNAPAVGKGFLPRTFRDKPGGPAKPGAVGRPRGTFQKSDRPVGESLPPRKLIEKVDGLRGLGGFAGGLVAIQSIKVDRGAPVRVGEGCLRVRSDRNPLVLKGVGFGNTPGTLTVALGSLPLLQREGAGRAIRVTVTAWSDTSIKLTTGAIYPRTGEGARPASQGLKFLLQRHGGGEAISVVPICPERRVVDLELAGLLRGSPSPDNEEIGCASESDRRFDLDVIVTSGPEPWSDSFSVLARETVAVVTVAELRDRWTRRRWSGRARLSLPVRWFRRELNRYKVFVSCSGRDVARLLPVNLSFAEDEWYKQVFVRLYSERDLGRSGDMGDELPPLVEGAAPLYIREIRVLNEEIPRGLFPGIAVRVDRLTTRPLPGVTTTHFVEIQRIDEGLPPTRRLRLPLQPAPGGGWQAVLEPERARRLYATGVAVDWGAQLEVRLARAGRSAGIPVVLERRRVRIPESTRWNVEVRLKEVRVRESGDDDLTRGDGDWEQVLLHFGRCMEEVDFGTTQVPDGAVLRPVRPVRCAVRGVTLPQRGMVTVYEDDGSATMRVLATAFGRFAIPDPSTPTRSPLSDFRVRITGRGLDADAFLEVVMRRSLPRTVLFSR